jgi:hypothetical protein
MRYTDKKDDDFSYPAKGLKTMGILEVSFRLLGFLDSNAVVKEESSGQ